MSNLLPLLAGLVLWAFSALLSAQQAGGDESQSVDSTVPEDTASSEIASKILSASEQVRSTDSRAVGLWKRIWNSPRQLAQEYVQSKDYQALAKETGDSRWQATGQYRSGAFQEAADSFANGTDDLSLYNQATALAHAGEFDESLQIFDQLLAQNPTHENAIHNRKVVEELKKQGQQPPPENSNDQQGEDQESNQESNQGEAEDGESKEGGSDDQGSQSQQENENTEEKQSDSESGNQQDASDSEESTDDAREQAEMTEQERQAAEQETARQQAAAKQALEDARQQAEQELRTEAFEQEPLSESEQATEQWLRQIPDDPAGLLRRKLQRNHASDYQGTGDSRQPW